MKRKPHARRREVILTVHGIRIFQIPCVYNKLHFTVSYPIKLRKYFFEIDPIRRVLTNLIRKSDVVLLATVLMDPQDAKKYKSYNWVDVEPTEFGAALCILRVRYGKPDKNFDELCLSHLSKSEFSSLSQSEINVLMMDKAKRLIQTLPPMHINEFELMMEILDDEDIENIRTSHLPIIWSDMLDPERYPYNDPE